MKTAGIIGGIGPASTIEYYRLIIALYREHARDDSYPQFIINRINLTRLRTLIEANNLPEVTDDRGLDALVECGLAALHPLARRPAKAEIRIDASRCGFRPSFALRFSAFGFLPKALL
jgi:hypothetical protein